MMRKQTVIIISVSVGLVAAAGLSVLIWWLVRDTTAPDVPEELTVDQLEGPGFGNIRHSAGITRVPYTGDVFWWFYPSVTNAASKPIILWLDGVTGLPPSLLANFGMFGPYDANLNERTDSWVDEFNLLFIDPLGVGFSRLRTEDPLDFDDNGKYLATTLETFFSVNTEYEDNPLYIFGQGSGAQLAISLAIQLTQAEFNYNLRGISIGNGIVSPAVALTKLGWYLEEWGYIDGQGFTAVQTFSDEINSLVNAGRYEEAFDKYITLEEFINNDAGAVAINVGHIVEKLTDDSVSRGNIKQENLRNALPDDITSFMNGPVAQGLGIESGSYDEDRFRALQAARSTFMRPSVDKLEYLLSNTNIRVTIYNGNVDAVSNTPGQLEWVNNLNWVGQEEFLSSPRQTVAVNGICEGYVRGSGRLQFYWINYAGVSSPLDNPIGMRRVLELITANNS